MEIKELVCVNCPMSCHLEIQMEGTNVLSVTGNTCPRGEAYARQECVCPMRILTSTVKVENGMHRVLPVITEKEIPLEKTEEAMKEIKSIVVQAPILCKDVIIEDIAHTGVRLLASRSMK